MNLGLLLIASLLVISTPSSMAVHDAQACFDRARWGEGATVLREAMEDATLSMTERGQVMLRWARFCEQQRGAPEAAVSAYRRAVAVLPEEMKQVALTAETRISDSLSQYKDGFALLARLRFESQDRSEATHRIALIEGFLKEYVDFPASGQMYYYLGRNLTLLGRERAAWVAYDRALEIAPALVLDVPVARERAVARGRWLAYRARRAALVVLGGVGLVAFVLFWVVYPQRWLRFRHCIVLLLGVGGWTGLFFAPLLFVVQETGVHQEVGGGVVATGGVLNGPSAFVMYQLFAYGVIGITTSFMLALGMARFGGWTALFATGTGAIGVMMALLTLFYQSYLLPDVTEFDGETIWYRPGARVEVSLPVLTPYVLTDPAMYAGGDWTGVQPRRARAFLETQYASLHQLEMEAGKTP